MLSLCTLAVVIQWEQRSFIQTWTHFIIRHLIELICRPEKSWFLGKAASTICWEQIGWLADFVGSGVRFKFWRKLQSLGVQIWNNIITIYKQTVDNDETSPYWGDNNHLLAYGYMLRALLQSIARIFNSA